MTTSEPSRRSERFRSIDALRGLVILAMIFVNDLAGVGGVPAWMKHVSPPDADGMTFVDVVFPAFLFIVGVSIPFALGRRIEREGGTRAVWRHVLTRTLALLVIGVFMVNGEMGSDQGRLPLALWSLLLYAAVFLLFGSATSPAREPGRRLQIALRATGVALLVALAFLYRGRGEVELFEMRTHWWGILGLIGWAYLVACAVYVLLKDQLAGIVGAMALLNCSYMAYASNASGGLLVGSVLGSHPAITVSGVALGIALATSPLSAHSRRLRFGLLYALALAAGAHLLHAAHHVHRMFFFSKIFATPPWGLLSAAITVALWVFFYWTMDVRRWAGISPFLEAAGQNALAAYFLAFVFDALFSLVSQATGLPNFYAAWGASFGPGLLRSLLFAVFVTWLAGRLRRLGFQLSL
jgi:predicted acyltransferase